MHVFVCQEMPIKHLKDFASRKSMKSLLRLLSRISLYVLLSSGSGKSMKSLPILLPRIVCIVWVLIMWFHYMSQKLLYLSWSQKYSCYIFKRINISSSSPPLPYSNKFTQNSSQEGALFENRSFNWKCSQTYLVR